MQTRRRNPYHLDPLSPHYLVCDTQETPFIYTSSISYCVGIGFIRKINNVVTRIAIYHSYGEHMDCDDAYVEKNLQGYLKQDAWCKPDNLIRAMYDFFLPVENMSDITVIVHINENCCDSYVTQKDPTCSSAYLETRRLMNRVCRLMGKNEIKQFHYHKGGDDFILLNDGTFYSRPYSNQEIQYIAKTALLYITRCLFPKGVDKVKSCFTLSLLSKNGRTINHLNETIMESFQQAQREEIRWTEACELIYRKLKAVKKGNSLFLLFKEHEEKENVLPPIYNKLLFIVSFFFEPLDKRINAKPDQNVLSLSC